MNVAVRRCDFKPGDLVAGKYSIEKVLGEGSFGRVYKIASPRGGSAYALKLFKFWEMPPNERKHMYARFEMEYETGRIKSDYLVQSVDHGLVEGNPFLVMEFCPNGDLRQFVDGRRGVSLAKIGRDTLCGLRDLHACGKVHRDLKPENVLVKTDGTAALTDFGLSGDKVKKLTETDFLGRPKFVAGTVIYMAPEQAKPRNREVTVLPTMDIFAFGVMMYYLITERYPFGKLDDQNDLVMYLKNAREGKWNRGLLSGSPDGKAFEQLITGCLIPDFRQRLQTVDNVLPLLPQTGGFLYPDSDENLWKTTVNGILLRVMQGEEHGAAYRLNDLIRGKSRVITVGRNDDEVKNILPITENLTSYVSRKHCTLEPGPGNQWFIRDGQWDRSAPDGWKNSLNGTFVNSTEASFEGVPIHPGDIITIGDVKLRVEGY